jgi:hypothetical protein
MQITGTRSRGPVVVVMAIVALGVAGCGSSDSDVETPAGPSTSSTGPAPSSAGPISSGDPATLEGGCDILLGDEGVLDAALAAGEGDDEAERQRVQDRLFAIVSAENDSLGDAAGQLVDYLDDPSAYMKDGELDASITTAEADVRETCDVL